MYLDPGFGSMVIQIVIAAIAAFGSFLFIIRDKLFRKSKKKKAEGEELDGQADN